MMTSGPAAPPVGRRGKADRDFRQWIHTSSNYLEAKQHHSFGLLLNFGRIKISLEARYIHLLTTMSKN